MEGVGMDAATLVLTAFLFFGVALAVILVTIPRWLAPREPNPLKSSTYECGEVPVGTPWIRFRIAYYIFALIFVIFDVEAVFLFPWAVIMKRLGVLGLVEMALFVGVLSLGLVYAWRKGVLEWQ
jgi:NADH-quinone oxidoreductase subunit A